MNAVQTVSKRMLLVRQALRRWWPTSLLGLALTLTGCAAVASLGAAILTGLFIGRMATSLQATANSYRYSDVGDVGLQFASPAPFSITLVRFFGRLPGFHIVFINAKDGTTSQSQGESETEAVVYDTDVEIDFTTSPPTFTGMARERDGDGILPLDEIYPTIRDVRGEIGAPDADGARRLSLTLSGENASGDEIAYSLTLNLGADSATGRLNATVEVQRTLTPVGGEPETITGTGSLNAERGTEDEP